MKSETVYWSKNLRPNVRHQRVSRRLQRILEDYFWELDPDGEIFNLPLWMLLSMILACSTRISFYVSGEQKLS